MDPESTASSLIGKHVLIGITHLDQNGELLSQSQMHGDVTRIEGQIVHIALRPDGNDYALPMDWRSLQPAPAGDYRLRSTGEVVTNPDFLCAWTVHEKKKSPTTESQEASDS